MITLVVYPADKIFIQIEFLSYIQSFMVIAKETKCTTRKIEKPVIQQTKLTEKNNINKGIT